MISKKYYLNLQQQDSDNNNYEVHSEDCDKLPKLENRIDLGSHLSCRGAMAEAMTRRPEWSDDIDGCALCCPDCHLEG